MQAIWIPCCICGGVSFNLSAANNVLSSCTLPCPHKWQLPSTNLQWGLGDRKALLPLTDWALSSGILNSQLLDTEDTKLSLTSSCAGVKEVTGAVDGSEISFGAINFTVMNFNSAGELTTPKFTYRIQITEYIDAVHWVQLLGKYSNQIPIHGWIFLILQYGFYSFLLTNACRYRNGVSKNNMK